MGVAFRNFIRGAVIAGGVLTLGGCASTIADIFGTPGDAPVFTVQAYDAANRCLRGYIEPYLRRSNRRVLFLINELPDRTRNPADPTSGPLSYGGQLVLTSLLRTSAPNDLVKLPLVTEQRAQLYFAGQLLPVSVLQNMRRYYDANLILGVTGGFTAFDQTRGANEGGAAASARRNDFDAQVEFGQSAEGGLINLVILIGDVTLNRTLGTVRLSGTARRRSDSFRGTVEVEGFGGGVSINTVRIDGIQNMQENLLGAAHFYMWAALLPGSDELSCLYNDRTSPAFVSNSMSAYRSASRIGQVKLLQQALNHFFGMTRTPLQTDGIDGPRTQAAIRAAARILGVPEPTPGVYASIYQRLITREPI